MARGSLFDALDALFNKREIEDPPGTYILHRFLASDMTYARVARDVALEVRDEDLAVGVWRTVLPRQAQAPYLSYTAPGSPDDADVLTNRLLDLTTMSREEAERARELIRLQGCEEEVAEFYGIEPDELESEGEDA